MQTDLYRQVGWSRSAFWSKWTENFGLILFGSREICRSIYSTACGLQLKDRAVQMENVEWAQMTLFLTSGEKRLTIGFEHVIILYQVTNCLQPIKEQFASN